MTTDQVTGGRLRRRGRSALAGAGTVDMKEISAIYSLKLRKKSGRQSILFTHRAPVLASMACRKRVCL
jgi:hypothetical protein